MTLLGLIIWIVIIGFIAWLVTTAPFIDPQFKSVIKWLLIVVVAVLVIMFLIDLIGGGSIGNTLNLR